MTDEPKDEAPKCPGCGDVMVLRTAKQGKNAGLPFWGCSRFPKCKGTRAIPKPEEADEVASASE